MALEGTGAGCKALLGGTIGTTDLSLTLQGPLDAAWPSSGTVGLTVSDTERMRGTISGTSVTNLTRVAEKYKNFTTAQPHTAGDEVLLVASYPEMQNMFCTKIDEAVLSSSAASVTFPNLIGSLPTTFRNLLILYTAKSDTAATFTTMNLFFNGDTGASYVIQQIQGNNNVVTSVQTAAFTASPSIAYINAANGTANVPGVGSIEIPNYSGTTFVKVAQSKYSTTGADSLASEVIGQFGLRWNSTVAITSVKLQPAAGLFIPGSAFTLYGLP